MREWEKTNLSECERAKCICPRCVHQDDHEWQHELNDSPLRSCCARHTNAVGVSEDPDDICGIAECPDFKEGEQRNVYP